LGIVEQQGDKTMRDTRRLQAALDEFAQAVGSYTQQAMLGHSTALWKVVIDARSKVMRTASTNALADREAAYERGFARASRN
jgi:hypothetical protein